ncbi:MAG: glycosyl transferase family 1, partial [Chloroflexus aggregans]
MRVVHVSTNDISGGAARAAYRLHQGLLQLGCASRMVVAHRWSDDPTVQALVSKPGFIGTWQRRWRGWRIRRDMQPYLTTRPPGLEPFSDDRSRYGYELPRALPACDVVTLHWVAGLLDYG